MIWWFIAMFLAGLSLGLLVAVKVEAIVRRTYRFDTECGTCGRPYSRVTGMPRWEDDKTVIKFGWVEGRCPECGAELETVLTNEDGSG